MITKPMPQQQDDSAGQDKGPDPQELLQQGKQLCMIGESLVSAAQSMGAVDHGDGEEYDNGDSEGSSDQGSANEGQEMGGGQAPAAKAGDPRKMAIVLAIQKKLAGAGKK